DELYDLVADPLETDNLIFSKEHQPIVKQMNQQLFDRLNATSGMYIPLYRDRGGQQNLRRKAGSKAATFPPEWMREHHTHPQQYPPSGTGSSRADVVLRLVKAK
ncbi:MAG: hypothetical protein ACREEM_49665, partial [Blastocatellia bacterium]